MAMSARLLRPRATGFSPKSIAGLHLWLDAADSSTITTGTGVSEWRDKSATGSTWTQATGNNQPATGTATINGKNVLVFDGTNDSLTASAPLSTSMPLTMFIVQRISTATVAGMTYAAGTGDAFNMRQAGSTSGFLEVIAAGARMFLGSSGRTGINDIVSVTFPASTDGSLFVNGVSQSPLTNATLKPTLTGTHYIGRRADGFYLNGQVAEILAYAAELSASQRRAAEAYLGKKWGITVS
jgi:hypothetical protein